MATASKKKESIILITYSLTRFFLSNVIINENSEHQGYSEYQTDSGVGHLGAKIFSATSIEPREQKRDQENP